MTLTLDLDSLFTTFTVTIFTMNKYITPHMVEKLDRSAYVHEKTPTDDNSNSNDEKEEDPDETEDEASSDEYESDE